MGEYVDTMWEIYQERARYLLNIDELLEEMHGTEIRTGDQLLACSNNCKKFVAIATA